MGGNVSRDITTVSSEEKSSTLPTSISWTGTFPRGISLEGNLTTKLTKFKKFEVTPKKKGKDLADKSFEEGEDEINTEFIESLIRTAIDEAVDQSHQNRGMTKSSTLPANLKGLGLTRSQSFGKRIRKSIKKLVVKTPTKKKTSSKSSEDIVESLLTEVLTNVTGKEDVEAIEELEKSELNEIVLEEDIIEEECDDLDEIPDGVNSLSLNTSKSSTLPAYIKGLGSSSGNKSLTKRIRKSIRKFVTPKKNRFGSPESINLVESILDDLIGGIFEESDNSTKEAENDEDKNDKSSEEIVKQVDDAKKENVDD